jgi:hypothetical protein
VTVKKWSGGDGRLRKEDESAEVEERERKSRPVASLSLNSLPFLVDVSTCRVVLVKTMIVSKKKEGDAGRRG